jgi:hypothetical protein
VVGQFVVGVVEAFEVGQAVAAGLASLVEPQLHLGQQEALQFVCIACWQRVSKIKKLVVRIFHKVSIFYESSIVPSFHKK